MPQPKAVVRNLTALHGLGTDHQFAFYEAHIIGQAHSETGYSSKLFISMKKFNKQTYPQT